MRVHGCIDSVGHLGSDGHACWAFHERQEFIDAALEFFAEGLGSGQRIAYIGSESVAEQRERLDPLGGVGAMIDTGVLQLFDLGDLYRVGEPVDAGAQLALYAAAADAAFADGYAGLRVAAQGTDLLTDPETWDAHARWESAADRVFSGRPLSAICGYQRGAVPPQILNDLAALHPAANVSSGSVPFHLFGEDGGLALTGEVDLFSSEALDRALEFACGVEEPASLDLEALEFIDHHGIEVLARHTRRLAAARGCRVRNRPPIVDRLCDLLELEL